MARQTERFQNYVVMRGYRDENVKIKGFHSILTVGGDRFLVAEEPHVSFMPLSAKEHDSKGIKGPYNIFMDPRSLVFLQATASAFRFAIERNCCSCSCSRQSNNGMTGLQTMQGTVPWPPPPPKHIDEPPGGEDGEDEGNGD